MIVHLGLGDITIMFNHIKSNPCFRELVFIIHDSVPLSHTAAGVSHLTILTKVPDIAFASALADLACQPNLDVTRSLYQISCYRSGVGYNRFPYLQESVSRGKPKDTLESKTRAKKDADGIPGLSNPIAGVGEMIRVFSDKKNNQNAGSHLSLHLLICYPHLYLVDLLSIDLQVCVLIPPGEGRA